ERQKLRPVRHHEADGVALDEPLRQRPAGIAVRALGEVAVAEALAVGQEGGRVAIARGELVDHPREYAGRVAGDVRSHPQRSQRAADAYQVSREPLDQSHGAFHGASLTPFSTLCWCSLALPVRTLDATHSSGSIMQPAAGGKRPRVLRPI